MFKPIALILCASALALPAAAHDSLENASKASANSAELAIKLPAGILITAVAVVSLPYIPPGTTEPNLNANRHSAAETKQTDTDIPLKVTSATLVSQQAPNS